ncbi:protein SCO1/2 [Povalibacter uvarum]|uniref:Protein SCO1/2 n=1 Tax=Povalibacter uvarum TaxID=732238 RepID=A0A841HEL6_9GAMM|nr:SCO family protein [Povalibacter uvarum]MBB6091561.1 protein SCO1/2 [Povalibacter uvarum]
MSRTPSIVVAAIVAIVAIASGMLLARSILGGGGSTQLGLARATLLEPARPLPDFTLVDQDGAQFGPQRVKNQWTLLFFGFTHCPDVCPTTLGMLAQTEKQLADLPEARRPHVVLVSVDPKRDTPQQLASYVKFFSPSFTGVTGSQESIDDFTRALGVPVGISPTSNGGYNVDHSAAIFLIDPNGAMRALFSTPHESQVIAADYRRIVTAD